MSDPYFLVPPPWPLVIVIVLAVIAFLVVVTDDGLHILARLVARMFRIR